MFALFRHYRRQLQSGPEAWLVRPLSEIDAESLGRFFDAKPSPDRTKLNDRGYFRLERRLE